VAHGDPTQVLWWLVSRASGILALVLISLSVVIGLAMATKTLRRPRLKRACARLHEQIALIALVAITVHGLALLGDRWLKPGLRGIAVPFAISYRTQFTALGITAGYLAVLLGPSFYLRRRIGARRWRQLHRATVAVWILAVIHTLGAGSDGATLWLRAIVLASGIPIAYLLVLRILQGDTRAQRAAQRPADPGSAAIQHVGRTHGDASAARSGRRPANRQVGEEPRPETA
jgi:methionine sulfoxide reductase heme-binding subunit